VAQTETNLLHLAEHLHSIGKEKAALDALARASSDEIESAKYWAIRVWVLAGLRRYEASHEVAQRGLERNPDDIELLDAFAVAELNLGFPGRALKALDKALRLSPANPILLTHRALALAHRRDFEEAEVAIGEALRIAPEYWPVLQTRAQIAVLANDRRANRYIDDLLRVDPENRIGHVLRGRVAAKRKHFVSAARAWEEAARLHPGDDTVAAAAREARVRAHPLLAPARLLLWRLGRWPFYLLCYVIAVVVASTGHLTFWVALAAWSFLVLLHLLTELGPEVIRRRQNRKYGDF